MSAVATQTRVETFTFECEGEQLPAVLHRSEDNAETGVVIVVGGPQYRVGSHRQFVLLARAIAAKGFATLRFDYRGMGDGGGPLRGFEFVDKDIRAAIDAFVAREPKIKNVVLWGLCDGASAIGFYANSDSRVVGAVLLNPWVRSEQTLARSLLFHYYRDRLLNVDAWRKLLLNPAALKRALQSVGKTIGAVFGVKPSTDIQSSTGSQPSVETPSLKQAKAASSEASNAVSVPAQGIQSKPDLLARLSVSLDHFQKPLLLILSGADITANEFAEGAKSNRRLGRRLHAASVTQHKIDLADHTFSRREWRDTVANWTTDWLNKTYRS